MVDNEDSDRAFGESLIEIFGERGAGFSPDLRGSLRDLWEAGRSHERAISFTEQLRARVAEVERDVESRKIRA